MDKFLDYHRASSGLQEYVNEFANRYDDAEQKSGLHINSTGLCHMLLKRSGLTEKAKDDIKLALGGNLTNNYEGARNLLLRMSRAPEPEGRGSYFGIRDYYGDLDGYYSGDQGHDYDHDHDYWCDEYDYSDPYHDHDYAEEPWPPSDSDGWQSSEWSESYPSFDKDGKERRRVFGQPPRRAEAASLPAGPAASLRGDP